MSTVENFKKAKEKLTGTEKIMLFLENTAKHCPQKNFYVTCQVNEISTGNLLGVYQTHSFGTEEERVLAKTLLSRITEVLTPLLDGKAHEIACLLTDTPMGEMPVIKEPNRVLAGQLATEAEIDEGEEDEF